MGSDVFLHEPLNNDGIKQGVKTPLTSGGAEPVVSEDHSDDHSDNESAEEPFSVGAEKQSNYRCHNIFTTRLDWFTAETTQ